MVNRQRRTRDRRRSRRRSGKRPADARSIDASDPAEGVPALTSIILDDPARYTIDEVAERAGLDIAVVRRLWRAMGFPDAGDGAVFGADDVHVVSLVARSVGAELLDENTVIRSTRALGQTMAKLADWQVQIMLDQIDGQLAEGGVQNRRQAAYDLTAAIEPGFEHVLRHAWRRHLAAAAARMEAMAAADSELSSTTMTVGFADLSRFTAMTNALSVADLGDVVEEFEVRATDVITAGGGRMIKALGDAVLFVNDDSRAAVDTSLEIIANLRRGSRMPSVRVGLATGSVLSRLGDVFGPPVNMAARLSHVARSHRVLVDSATADSLPVEEYVTRVLSPRVLRGFGEVSPITVARRRAFRSAR